MLCAVMRSRKLFGGVPGLLLAGAIAAFGVMLALAMLALAMLAAAMLAPAALAHAKQANAGKASQSEAPAPHTAPWPQLGTGKSKSSRNASLQLSPEYTRGVSAKQQLEQRRRLDAAIDALAPQRPGTMDAYVLTIAFDSDPVFAREAREAGRVLSRRYNAAERTLVMAGPDNRPGGSAALPHGSISAFSIALARLAEIMDRQEDVLVIYTTSHGIPQGLTYHYGDNGFGVLSPQFLRDTLSELGLDRRILILSACFSGVFVPYLAGEDTAILTASSFNRSSFGCKADNDWTFYGDALINRALRKPQSLGDAAAEAGGSIATWEEGLSLKPSLPQVLIGERAKGWLIDLERQIPRRATRPVGRPAVGK